MSKTEKKTTAGQRKKKMTSLRIFFSFFFCPIDTKLGVPKDTTFTINFPRGIVIPVPVTGQTPVKTDHVWPFLPFTQGELPRSEQRGGTTQIWKKELRAVDAVSSSIV